MEQKDLDFYNSYKGIIKIVMKNQYMDIDTTARYIVAPDSLTCPFRVNGSPALSIESYRELTPQEIADCETCRQCLVNQIPMIVWRLQRSEKLLSSDRFGLRDYVGPESDFDKLTEYREQLRNWPDVMQQNGTIVQLVDTNLVISNALLRNDDAYWPPVPKFQKIKL